MNKEQREHIDYLLRLCSKAVAHLEYSHDRASNVPLDVGVPSSDLEKLDAYAVRFVRLYELTVKQLLRLVLVIEREDLGSKTDQYNKAASLNLIPSVEAIDELRILRNQVSHDYTEAEWQVLYAKLLTARTLLIETLIMITRSLVEKYEIKLPDGLNSIHGE